MLDKEKGKKFLNRRKRINLNELSIIIKQHGQNFSKYTVFIKRIV